jgi:hypothetical protein
MTWYKARAQSSQSGADRPHLLGRPASCWRHFNFRFANVSRRVDGWPAGHVYNWSARVWWVTTSNQRWSSLTPPINTPHTPFSEIEIRKWGLASYSALKFILCRLEGERRGSEGWKTSRHVGSPQSSSSAEALPEFIRVRWSFPSSSSVECRSSIRILQILIENRLSSPSGVLEWSPGLSGLSYDNTSEWVIC